MNAEKTQSLVESLGAILWKILENMDDKVDGATFNQLAGALGIVIDRVQRLRTDLPTQEEVPKIRLENLSAEELTQLTRLLGIVAKPS